MTGKRSFKPILRSITQSTSRNYQRGRSETRVVSPYVARRQQHFLRSVATVTTLGVVATLWQSYADGRLTREVHAEAPPVESDLQFERPRKKGISKENTRDLISSQHLQVKRSWENPGVYAWGSNTGKVVAPDSDAVVSKIPKRIPYFDNILLKDLKLDKNFGAAIDENGDLLQWGTGFSRSNIQPVRTLRGKGLTNLALSRDRILGLASDGTVYSIPVSQEDQKNGAKPMETSWIPFWTSKPEISYRKLLPANLGWGEKVSAIAGGLEHALLLTSTGRVFSVAAGSQDFPSRGQLGIPGLTWTTRPEGAYDQCHEVMTLRGFRISSIAAGDYHSLVSDDAGRVFAFGDNSYGQLGFEYTSDSSIVDAPSLLPMDRLYAGTGQVPRVTSVAAGGTNSYFTVDATRVATRDTTPDAASQRLLGQVTADTWSCGQGIWGALGNGRWTHVQAVPSKIPALSGLFEYDETTSKTVPIRLSRLSVGSNHVAAVMNNVTHLASSTTSSENDTNWGADILFFGNNEFYQLGTGKRNNISNPTYIQPLDMDAEKKIRGREEHRFQITPKKKIKVNGRWVAVEQRVECGRGVTAVYSGV